MVAYCVIVMGSTLRYPYPRDQIFYRIFSDISGLLRETTLTILDSIKTGPPVETEIVRVVSLSTTEITEITQLKKKKKKNDLQGKDTLVKLSCTIEFVTESLYNNQLNQSFGKAGVAFVNGTHVRN